MAADSETVMEEVVTMMEEVAPAKEGEWPVQVTSRPDKPDLLAPAGRVLLWNSRT